MSLATITIGTTTVPSERVPEGARYLMQDVCGCVWASFDEESPVAGEGPAGTWRHADLGVWVQGCRLGEASANADWRRSLVRLGVDANNQPTGDTP